MADRPSLYPHRQNADGSYDSICTTCFATIARSTGEAGLTEGEATHVWGASLLSDRGHYSRVSP